MSETTPDDWSRLVAERDHALVRWTETGAALDALPVQRSFDSEEERLHEQAHIDLNACEDRIFEATPPDLAAAALQVKIFAERFHSTDVEGAPLSGEDKVEGAILRRLYAALSAGFN